VLRPGVLDAAIQLLVYGVGPMKVFCRIKYTAEQLSGGERRSGHHVNCQPSGHPVGPVPQCWALPNYVSPATDKMKSTYSV